MEETRTITAGVPRETFPDENRVAVVADAVPLYKKAGISLVIESGAGLRAGIPDDLYLSKGAEIVTERKEVFERSRVILQVRGLGANPDQGKPDLEWFSSQQLLVSFYEPLTAEKEVRSMAEKGVSVFALEMLPRITRAQSMDALSSMATVAGYKAVLLAAQTLPKMFPLLMTAAGTVSPAHVFVIGAGVAGLQAIATARRLGAVVQAYDVRPAVKEQVESLGARFVQMEIDAGDAETKGGYAREMDESFYHRQRELMTRVVAENDVVITTAAVPGKKAPVLITSEMVKGMRRGSVIIDLVAERGGNCELTQADRRIEVDGVIILGPVNLPATVPYHASEMYSRNLLTFMKHLVKEGEIKLDMEDEITRETLLTRDGEIVNTRLRELYGLDKNTERSES